MLWLVTQRKGGRMPRDSVTRVKTRETNSQDAKGDKHGNFGTVKEGG